MKSFITHTVTVSLVFGIMFWNLENYFDYFDGGFSTSDSQFSSKGEKHWTKARFMDKTAMIAKTILWAGAPDIVGVCEVENAFVLRRLCGSEILYKYGYSYVHHESHDHRGIDVALLYKSHNWTVLNERAVPVLRGTDTLATRDILYVCLQDCRNDSEGEIWHLMVNHHPSKFNESKAGGSEEPRVYAMLALKNIVDSLHCIGVSDHIVAMGDFNDTPDAEAFRIISGSLKNLGLGVNGGSIRFNGQWELIDNFLVSEDVCNKKKMTILRPSFLLERDKKHPGEKPLRTYSGPRYKGGVSDHLPVMLD